MRQVYVKAVDDWFYNTTTSRRGSSGRRAATASRCGTPTFSGATYQTHGAVQPPFTMDGTWLHGAACTEYTVDWAGDSPVSSTYVSLAEEEF